MTIKIQVIELCENLKLWTINRKGWNRLCDKTQAYN